MITLGIMIIGLGIAFICFALIFLGGFAFICLIPVVIVLGLLKIFWHWIFDKES